MPSLESLGSVVYTDILIVGGGIAGLSAAITAKETSPDLDVLVADRSTASQGRAGKSARTAGLLSFVTEQDDPESFMKYCLDNIGFYLNDQFLLREFAISSRPLVQRLIGWGVEVSREANGQIAYAKWPFPWGTASVDPDMCVAMARYAQRLGVRFTDKFVVVDLLKDGDRIAGAAGFNILDGSYSIFRAGAVVLANGSQNYDVTPLWCGSGNGIAAAYKAGAGMRNAEFGNMCDFARVDPRGWVYYGVHGGAHIAHDHLHGADGENISQKHRPGLHSSMDPMAALAWYRETLAGNGPVTVDLSRFGSPGDPGEAGTFFRFHPQALDQMRRMEIKANFPETRRFEVVPGFIGELSCVQVDPQMATTVSGLFAVGDISGSGSARAGAVPAPPAKIHGTGILNALFMGTKGGPSAAAYARTMKAWGVDARLDCEQVQDRKENLYAPLRRRDGIPQQNILRRIQDAIAPVDRSVIKSEKRLKEGLEEIQGVAEDLGSMKAESYHELARCVDVESQALCAEMFFKASLVRAESRGFHYREDHPDMDNQNWLKWIILKNVEGEMTLSTEDVPIDIYPYKPARREAGTAPS